MRRKIAMLAALAVLGVGGTLAGVAAPIGGGVQAAQAHVGNATFDCNKGVQFNFDSFPNVDGNTVHVWAKVDGVKKLDKTITFDGSSVKTVWYSLGTTDTKTTFRAGGSWSADGGGSFDTGDVPLDCSKPCQPVTVTIVKTVTTPGPTTTVTTPGPTTTVTTPGSTTTVTSPGPTTTVTNTVTTPPVTVTSPPVTTPGQTVTVHDQVPGPTTVTTPAQTTTVTTTVKSPPKVLTITKTKVKYRIVYRNGKRCKVAVKVHHPKKLAPTK